MKFFSSKVYCLKPAKFCFSGNLLKSFSKTMFQMTYEYMPPTIYAYDND